jgi:hypothetical protein
MSSSVKLPTFSRVLSSWTQFVIPTLILFLSYGIIVRLQLNRLSQLESKASQVRSKTEYLREEKQTQASLQLLSKLPTFGFDNLVSDWSFLNFLQYFGDDQARPQTKYRITPDFFRVIVDRDPRFLAIYPYLCQCLALWWTARAIRPSASTGDKIHPSFYAGRSLLSLACESD